MKSVCINQILREKPHCVCNYGSSRAKNWKESTALLCFAYDRRIDCNVILHGCVPLAYFPSLLVEDPARKNRDLGAHDAGRA